MNRYYEHNENDDENDPLDRSHNLLSSLISTSDADLIRIDIESITFFPQKTQLFSGINTDETLFTEVTTRVVCTNLELCVKLGEEGIFIILDRYLEGHDASVGELISILDDDEIEGIGQKDSKIKEIIFMEINQVVGFKVENRNIYFEFDKEIVREYYCYPSESATQKPEVTNKLLENATSMIAKPKNIVSKDRLMKFKEGVNLQRIDRFSYEPTFNLDQAVVPNQKDQSNYVPVDKSTSFKPTESKINNQFINHKPSGTKINKQFINYNKSPETKFNNQFINNKPPETKFKNQFINNKPPEARINNQSFTNNKLPETKINNQFTNNKPPEARINNQFTYNKPPETRVNNQFNKNKTINNQPKHNTTKYKYSSFTINYTIDSPNNRTALKSTLQISEKATLEELLSDVNKQIVTSSFDNISEGIPRKFYYENNFNQKIMIVDEEDWRIAKWERKKSGNTEFFIRFC
ncbi:hypothetical protein F8M41_006693 [Gigaspora margarita]|uniref:Uncharacterized protein n=1 Tax=Gigaspora margarita TaxID=4874 RepID=A0A8H3X619_GIGMA|nr:hypothetical protein F8M41_006693 [Gigaspora margarita]